MGRRMARRGGGSGVPVLRCRLCFAMVACVSGIDTRDFDPFFSFFVRALFSFRALRYLS